MADDIDLPILGTEPVSVEFANTLYGTGEDRVDFLDTPHGIEQWLAQVSVQHGVPAEAKSCDTLRIRELRDAVRAVLLATIDGQAPGQAALDTVNDAAAAAPTHLRLSWASKAAVATRLDTSAGQAALLGRLATSCIELASGPDAAGLRRCDTPDCSLLFVRTHQRRRYCHPSCSHRDRQARYYHRRTAGASA
ncbi:CGNR zinc finger domain-containing protein [Nonomuraea sp. NPDC050663]|uniref:CGNR zinc finger domain-containing protein n=1 Tax=Nonomuraea sp. NPDC050663 TaxID=3364370 RepID=UPI0037B6585D